MALGTRDELAAYADWPAEVVLLVNTRVRRESLGGGLFDLHHVRPLGAKDIIVFTDHYKTGSIQTAKEVLRTHRGLSAAQRV